MNIIEITPPKQLNFTLPNDMHRVLTLTNSTLHSVAILILKSHAEEMRVSEECFMMQAFEEKRVDICVNWVQGGENLSVGRLRVVYEELEEEVGDGDIRGLLESAKSKNYFEELSVRVTLDFKHLRFLNYEFS